jgi:hypothetical protein
MFDALEKIMRTTLAIDDDVLTAAKGLAARQKKSIGEVLSELARQSLRPAAAKSKIRNGVPLLPVQTNAGPVTLEVVNTLRDESP